MKRKNRQKLILIFYLTKTNLPFLPALPISPSARHTPRAWRFVWREGEGTGQDRMSLPGEEIWRFQVTLKLVTRVYQDQQDSFSENCSDGK